ncbi:AAA family ATPase [Testudinibacter aquarius]|uniref:AAA ATPase-like protein n=1 Tax=Testudinibacter aquarius TaxID=1524974 RepID=A0A4R3YAH8_9PAST|nr:ATP-binding protein [Testudinibacter aquarius]KAE9529840.1 AAA family ATPase [Testudinibacter aquarius]TCV89395.1 AAA ATPase-like protein [Testudinibacter aquarius]TNG93173.1 ATP-binding protein [Testudinibacter aquarius]
MDAIKNPFVPGAGTSPPELAGREVIIETATVSIKRASLGNQSRSQMLLGLRGVGKTVLLNHLDDIAQQNQHITSFIEANENINLIEVLQSEIQQVLKKLSRIEAIKDKAMRGFSVLKSFLSNFNFEISGISIEIEPELGSADSGKLESDLSELFVILGELAKEGKKPWTILIDEVQYLNKTDLAAFIVALHKCNQKNLPILFFGAGLPQVAAMSGDAKSYAERLFSYPSIGALTEAEAAKAIKNPIEHLGESISDKALALIYQKTKGYPYFLQEWGSQVWDHAISGSTISKTDVINASQQVFDHLDHGFFSVRLDRLTNAERDYVIAMASLGNGPYKTPEIAAILGKKNSALSNVRQGIINKGMIYSPTYGELHFTVPLFDDFLRRTFVQHHFIQRTI